MANRKVTGTLEVSWIPGGGKNWIINISFNMLVGNLSYWDASKNKTRKSVLRSGATISGICLVFPPRM